MTATTGHPTNRRSPAADRLPPRRELLLFSRVALGAFAFLLAVELLKGHAPRAALTFAAVWSGISTAVFIAAHHVRKLRGQACALCDEPASLRPPAPSIRADL